MNPKPRILFVDDEPMILAGLQRMLRNMRSEWDMAFADSGEQALEMLARSPYDVVVSDMRMPGMSGAARPPRVGEPRTPPPEPRPPAVPRPRRRLVGRHPHAPEPRRVTQGREGERERGHVRRRVRDDPAGAEAGSPCCGRCSASSASARASPWPGRSARTPRRAASPRT